MDMEHTRPETYLYQIRNSDPYFHAGRIANGEQSLLGLHLPTMVGVLFDEEGKFISTIMKPYSFTMAKRDDGTVVVDGPTSTLMRDDLMNWEKELGFVPGIIRIRRFALPDYFIHLQDLPSHYEDFLSNKAAYDKERVGHLEQEIVKWLRGGYFVLQWNEEYHMSKGGRIVST
jgi:hypothetical protein